MAWFNPDVAAYLLERPVKNANLPDYNMNLRRLLATDNAARLSGGERVRVIGPVARGWNVVTNAKSSRARRINSLQFLSGWEDQSSLQQRCRCLSRALS
jgi:hypothetical protein